MLFFWGLVSPRSQWYILVGWTRSNPRATEPGSAAYAAGRFVFLLGLLSLLTIGVSWAVGAIRFPVTQAERALSATERVWGSPRSFVVDRVFTPLGAPPAGLAEQPIMGYQLVDGRSKNPAYLYDLGKIRQAGIATLPGFIGVPPLPNSVALDTADLVVQVHADARCIPQQVVVSLVDSAVRLGVFFGQPNPPDGSNVANLAACDPSPPADRVKSYLIPIDLTAPLGSRAIQSLDGKAIRLVPLPAR